MDQDRIWSRVQTGQPGGAVKLTAASEATDFGTPGVDATCVARLEAERDQALAEAERMCRAMEVARHAAVQERSEAQAEIERLRGALEITRHAAEGERDLARGERKRLADQLKAQKQLLEHQLQPARTICSWLFGGRRPRGPVHVQQGAPLADTAADQPCLIKGKISRGGERIYHLPGGRWYDRTKIDAAKGERWFRTEEEARVAGWRAARE